MNVAELTRTVPRPQTERRRRWPRRREFDRAVRRAERPGTLEFTLDPATYQSIVRCNYSLGNPE